MNLGVRAHNFGKLPLEELVEKVAEKKFSSVQLASSKAVEGINAVPGSLSPGMAHYIGSAFKKKDIQIAVLGCYINPIHPDKAERRRALELFKEHIRYARDFGCSIVATETGSLNADSSFNIENYGEEALKSAIESVSELVEEAERFGVIVGIEAASKNPIYTSKRMKILLDAVKSNNLQVVFDPYNLINIEKYKNQQEVFEEAMSLFGDRIVAMHAKDFVIDNGVKKSTPVGTGLLNYEYIFKLLKPVKPFLDIIMEDIKEQHMDEGIEFLRNTFNGA